MTSSAEVRPTITTPPRTRGPARPPLFDLRDYHALDALLKFAEARAFARRYGPEIFEAGRLRDVAVSLMAQVPLNQLSPSGDLASFQDEEDALREWLAFRIAGGPGGYPRTPREAVWCVRRLAQVRRVEVAAAALRWGAERLEREASFASVYSGIRAAMEPGLELEGQA